MTFAPPSSALPSESPSCDRYDIVIIGGAIYGSSVAWWLTRNLDFDGSILVVERNPTYQFASTTHTNSCMRQQYSSELNVRISQFAATFVKNFREWMDNDPRVPDLPLISTGYLYLADTEDFARELLEAQAIQAKCGAGTRHMRVEQIAEEYPFYFLDDIVAANHNPIDEGYFDGATMFDWWKRTARERGAEYIANEVVDLAVNPAGTSIDAIILKSGERIGSGTVINASGPRAARTASMADIDLPVEPRKRFTFVFAAERPIDQPLPLTINPSGVHVRSDGAYYMAGCAPQEDMAVDYDDFVEDHDRWEAHVWPAIMDRIPQFDALRLINSWAGHYAYNRFDHNAITGRHTRIENFVFVNGFSGHGLQQSPAIGRGTSELILYGEYREIDLSPFDYRRIPENQPYVEAVVI